MHPDTLQLAAYLDRALDDAAWAELRAHILICAVCTARLERLRDDARRINIALTHGVAAPDLRADLRARLRRPGGSATWLWRGLGLAGALAALLLFAVLIAASSGATIGRVPDMLFVTDKSNRQLFALDGQSGARLNALKLDDTPTSIKSDSVRDRLYLLLAKSVLAIDPHTLQPIGRWQAAQPFDANTSMALDAQHGRLYVAQPDGITALDVAAPEPVATRSYSISHPPGALALTSDGATLFALDLPRATLWTIDIASGSARSQVLVGGSALNRSGWVLVSQDDQFVYVLLTRAGRGDQSALWQIDRRGQASAPTILASEPPVWDLELLETGQLAIPRGNGAIGGVELIATATLSTTLLDPNHDQHHVVVGSGGMLFGLNYTHNTITRFDAATRAVIWRTPEDRAFVPWDGVYLRGGWRWPWDA